MTDTPGRKPSRLETSALYQEIAIRTHLPGETVRLVLDAFIEVARESLANERKVIIRRFGTFLAKRVGSGGFDGVAIRFRPAEEFKSAAKEALRPMEKYGVATKNEATLLAQVTGECPDCKSKLDSTKPPKCPNCGTAPFEAKDGK